jgi:hypothetical protein
MVTSDSAHRLHDAMELLARSSSAILQQNPGLDNALLKARLRREHPIEFAIVFEGERPGPGDCHV